MFYFTGYEDYDEAGSGFDFGLYDKLYYNPTDNLYLWRFAYDGYWYISQYLGPFFMSYGMIFYPMFYFCNAIRFLRGKKYIWYSDTSPIGWVMTTKLGIRDDSSYYSGSLSYVAHEYKKESDPDVTVTLQRYIKGWKGPSLGQIIGEYTPQYGVTGNKYIGWKILDAVGDGRIQFLQQNEKVNDEFIFKCSSPLRYIWFDGTDWILSYEKNVKDITVGYWKLSGSNPVGTFERQYTGDSPPSPDEWSVTLSGRADSTVQREPYYIGRIATWLPQF